MNFIFYDLNGVDEIKLNKETDELEIFKPDGSSEKTKNSEGINELLFKERIDFSKVTEKDVDDYFIIFKMLSYNPGESKRIKEIRKKFPDISNKYSIRKFKELHENRIKTFPGSGIDACQRASAEADSCHAASANQRSSSRFN